MARSLRSRVTKTNNTKLRSRVFGPVEDARTERLSAKLLELAAQPRPENTKMDSTKEAEGEASRSSTQPYLRQHSKLVAETKEKPAQAESSEETRTTEEDEAYAASGAGGDMADDEGNFYNVLGVCTDVIGFGVDGRLLLSLNEDREDVANMDIDETAAGKSKPRSSKGKRPGRVQKRYRKVSSRITFPVHWSKLKATKRRKA